MSWWRVQIRRFSQISCTMNSDTATNRWITRSALEHIKSILFLFLNILESDRALKLMVSAPPVSGVLKMTMNVNFVNCSSFLNFKTVFIKCITWTVHDKLLTLLCLFTQVKFSILFYNWQPQSKRNIHNIK